MARRALIGSCVAAWIGLSSLPAFGAWPQDPINGNVALCSAEYDQISPVIVSDGTGGAIVAWADWRTLASLDIYAQRVDATGAPLWGANGVALCAADGDQFELAIVPDGAGGAIVAWADSRNGGSDIYAQRVNGAGVPQWTPDGVALCAAAGDQNFPAMMPLEAGAAVLAWMDARAGNIDVYAQRVNGAGTPEWTSDGVAIVIAGGDQYYPKMISDQAAGAIVAWMDPRDGNFDIYAQRVDATGAPQWSVNGVALCTESTTQNYPTLAPDGSGGAIVTWSDYREGLGNTDVYGQRVSAGGVVQWATNGVALCTATKNQEYPQIVSDDAGGAIMTWVDDRGTTKDIYAQRVSGAGVPQWTANGIPVCSAANNQWSAVISRDGAGGAIVTWEDYRAGSYSDVYAQRVDGAGTLKWTADGTALSTAASDQLEPAIASDGSAGAIVAWSDYRNDTDANVYAQRIEGYGYLGSTEPGTVTVTDVPNDQGGMVQVTWSASYLDAAPNNLITDYQVWKSTSSVAVHRQTSDGITTDSWVYVGTQPAAQQPSYSHLVPTSADSTAGSTPLITIRIEARYPGGSQYWYSTPVSGYSVDNLAPSTPTPFTAAYLEGATHLHWGANTEPDLAGYRLYRGSSSGFTPGPNNLISAQPDTGYADQGPAGSWYKVAAVDVHGNESVHAVLGPDGTVGVSPAAITAVSFAPPWPNPTSGGTTFRFALPRDGIVSLEVFDQQGRRVRRLVHGSLPAGEHRSSWDGRDESGRRVPSGLYFARFDFAGSLRIARLVRLH